EYPAIFVAEPCTDCKMGSSRNRPGGVAISSEDEATCFTHILESCATNHGLSVNEFVAPKLDEYFLHDRVVRECESGPRL
ncbi:hypothetical protein BJV78DRAFT_1194900, partial [Lactifluus subvellereus]